MLPPLDVLLVIGVAVLLGSVVQGVVGFGVALLAAPVIALTEPSLVPVTLLGTTVALPVLSVVRERRHVHWSGFGWALAGRVPGTVVGVAAVAVLAPRALALLVAASVAVAVVLSMSRWQPEPTPRAALLAGAVSGAFGTATSIGGPPVALLYQRASGPRVRATLAAYFAVGVTMSLAGLALTGQVQQREVLTALALLPFLAAGFAISGPLRRHVDHGRLRAAVLWLSGGSAVVLAVQALAG